MLLERELARLDLGDEQQVADEPQQPARVALDDLEEALGVGVEALAVVEDEVEVADDRRQRGAELVADEGEELVLQAFGLPLAGDVAQDDDASERRAGLVADGGAEAQQDAVARRGGQLVAQLAVGTRVGGRDGLDARSAQLAHRLVLHDDGAIAGEQRQRVGGRVEHRGVHAGGLQRGDLELAVGEGERAERRNPLGGLELAGAVAALVGAEHPGDGEDLVAMAQRDRDLVHRGDLAVRALDRVLAAVFARRDAPVAPRGPGRTLALADGRQQARGEAPRGDRRRGDIALADEMQRPRGRPDGVEEQLEDRGGQPLIVEFAREPVGGAVQHLDAVAVQGGLVPGGLQVGLALAEEHLPAVDVRAAPAAERPCQRADGGDRKRGDGDDGDQLAFHRASRFAGWSLVSPVPTSGVSWALGSSGARRTASGVSSRIFRSSQRDQFWMYQLSHSTRSASDVCPRSPWTWAQPVIPDFTRWRSS